MKLYKKNSLENAVEDIKLVKNNNKIKNTQHDWLDDPYLNAALYDEM